MYILGPDVGTSTIKTTLFELNGKEVCSAACESALVHPETLWVEQDMQAVWELAMETLQRVVSQASIEPNQVLALGRTGQGDGTWLVNREGMPVRPAIIWLDGRAGDIVRQLEREGRSQEIFTITGTVPNTCNQALQLRWLQDHESTVLNKAAWALQAKDWIFLCMTGTVSTDETDASHTYAKQIGLLPGTPVACGPFDVIASSLGVGSILPEEACTILGTAGIHQKLSVLTCASTQ